MLRSRHLLTCCAAAWLLAVSGTQAQSVIVATADSSDGSRARAAFVGDGEGDQEEIYAAVQSLPATGGTVLLMEGTYDIRRVEGTLGGLVIDRSHVTLAGQGTATRLVLAPDQNTNVIRIIGSDVGHITIRDLVVDANRAQNAAGMGDPDISHDRFEFCGIKAFRQAPSGPPAALDTHNITIQNCTVKNAHRLGIMLEGPNMRVLDNVLGNAGSDAVEILTGPGIIRGNYVEITEQTHVAIGSDRGDSILMTQNVVHVKPGGNLDIAFRSWAQSQRHVITDNVLTVEPQGYCALAMDVRGDKTTVMGNNLHSASERGEAKLRVSGKQAVLMGNILDNVRIELTEQADTAAIILRDNVQQ